MNKVALCKNAAHNGDRHEDLPSCVGRHSSNVERNKVQVFVLVAMVIPTTVVVASAALGLSGTGLSSVAYGKLWLRLEQLERDDPFRVLVLGLEGSGKSTLLHSLKLGDVETAVPTMGLHLEKIEHHNTSVASWDLQPLDRVSGQGLW